MRLINKKHLAVRHAASDDETRYVLNGVLVEEMEGNKIRTVATDGRILAMVNGSCEEEGNFPVLPELSQAPNTSTKSIIPSAAIDKAIKGLPGKKCKLPILENIALKMSENKATLISTDLNQTSVTPTNLIDGHFPNYEIVIPKSDPVFEMVIGIEVLEKVVDILRQFGSTSGRFSFTKSLEPFTVKDAQSGNELLIVGMPMKL